MNCPPCLLCQALTSHAAGRLMHAELLVAAARLACCAEWHELSTKFVHLFEPGVWLCSCQALCRTEHLRSWHALQLSPASTPQWSYS